MLLLVAIVTLVVVGILAWKALSVQGAEPTPVSRPARRTVAPDDDVDFLRRLGERVRRDDEDPPVS